MQTTKTQEILESGPVARVLERAHRVCATAVSIHRYDQGEETHTVSSCGGCAAACRYVSQLPWGSQSCRRSRAPHADAALRRKRPVPFMCHMGFACVAVPVDDTADPSESRFVAMLGPYCPAETPDALTLDATIGLEKLEHVERDELPFTLDDIPRVHAESPPATAEWLIETLLEHLRSCESIPDFAQEGDHDAPQDAQAHARRRPRPVRDPYQAHDVLSALTGGDQKRLRTLVQTILEHADESISSKRYRALALIAAVFEAAEGAGLDTSAAQERLSDLPKALSSIHDMAGLRRAALRTLAPLKRSAGRSQDPETRFHAALDRYLQAHLAQGATLTEAAAHLGAPPSTVTRRVQRRYGLSFSEYAGRLRVDRAKELLATTQLGIADIACRVGLKDSAHLRKLFQKFEGAPPSAFRARTGARRHAANR